MEQNNCGPAITTEPKPDLSGPVGVCVVFTLLLMFMMFTLPLAIPAAYRQAFAWFGAPVVYVVGAVLLSWATGTSRDIKLRGDNLTWKNGLVPAGVITAIHVVTQLLAWLIIWASSRQGATPAAGSALPPGYVAGYVIRSLVGSPISEELLFRGWLLSWLGRRAVGSRSVFGCTITAANLLTSLSFATGHLLNGVSGSTPLILAGVFAISLVLGRARERSGGLLLPMLCHSYANFLGVIVF